MSVPSEVTQKLDAAFGPSTASLLTGWFNELDSGTISTQNISVPGDVQFATNVVIGGGTVLDSIALFIGGEYESGALPTSHTRTNAIAIGEMTLTSNANDAELAFIHQFFADSVMELYQVSSPGATYACGLVFEGFEVHSTAARDVDICASIYIAAAPTLTGSATATAGPYALYVEAGDVRLDGRVTTTDGVASGTSKVVGGRCTANVSAADSVTAVASNNSFVSFAQTYSIPANTIKAGSVVRIRALVRVSNASGTDTLTINLRLGTTSLIATTAVDPGATTDIHIAEFELTGRAAPGAAASIVGSGRWITNTGGTIAHGTGLLGATNFATNGALVIDSQAKWSSNTANTACLLESLDVEIL